MPLQVAIGYDPRAPAAITCLMSSITRQSTVPVSLTPIVIDYLPIANETVGLTPFTYTRYLTPWLMGFKGKAIFLDADIVARGDIAELMLEAQGDHAVWCVKHEAKFEWPSVMVFDCAHEANKVLTPQYVQENYKQLPTFSWLGGRDSDLIGSLPHEWNHLVMYDEPSLEAKLIHFTAGIPIWPETSGCEHTEAWVEEMSFATAAISWKELMGNSRHVPKVKEHLIASGKLTSEGRDDGSVAPA